MRCGLTRLTSFSVLVTCAHLRGVRRGVPVWALHNSEGSFAENSDTKSPEAR